MTAGSAKLRFARVDAALRQALAVGALLLFGLLPLLAVAAPPSVGSASKPLVMSVRANGSIPGFVESEIPAYLAGVMAGTGPAAWRFVPSPSADPAPPNRIEFSFKTNPYAAGTVRTYGFSRATMERLLDVHHSITIEARLFLNGEYQTLAFQQVTVSGGVRDADLASAVAKLTRLLMAYPDLHTHSVPRIRNVEGRAPGTS